MTLNQRIIQALEPLGLPVAPDVDTLHRSHYLMFNYDLIPVQPADNRPTQYRILIQVHLYLPFENGGREIRGQVLEALVGAGMTWSEIIGATDEEAQHKIFEYETFVGKDGLQVAGKARGEATSYHGAQNMKFIPKKSGTYNTALLDVKYAQNIDPSTLLKIAEQYADNRLVCCVPSDTGYESEVGTTTPDPEPKKAAGFTLEGANGLITTNIASYLRDTLYYEFLELDEDGKQSVVKCQMFNVEIGKGSTTYTTTEGSVKFGAYLYPFRVYGDPPKDSRGTDNYKGERGVGRTTYLYTCRPDDTDYVTFGGTVPVPEVAAAPGPQPCMR